MPQTNPGLAATAGATAVVVPTANLMQKMAIIRMSGKMLPGTSKRALAES